MNALTPEMLGEVEVALGDIASIPEIKVAVMTEAGRAFCAGVDLKATQARGIDLSQGNMGEDLNAAARVVIEQIEALPRPARNR